MEDFIKNFLYEKPVYTESSDSIKIYTSIGNGNSYVEAMVENVIAKPAMIPAPLVLEPPEIVRTNNYVN